MTLPVGWPPRAPSGRYSLRFYVTDTATANFEDKAYLFGDQATATPQNVQPTGTSIPHTLSQPVHSPSGGGPMKGDPSHQIGADVGNPHRWSSSIAVRNLSSSVALEISFDGTNVHGKIPPSTTQTYFQRYESGIAVRGSGAGFVVEAW